MSLAVQTLVAIDQSFPRVSGDEPLIHWPTRTPIYVFPA